MNGFNTGRRSDGIKVRAGLGGIESQRARHTSSQVTMEKKHAFQMMLLSYGSRTQHVARPSITRPEPDEADETGPAPLALFMLEATSDDQGA